MEKEEKLKRIKEKYKIHENLILAKHARKTLRFIEKNTENFPTKYKVLRNRIIDSCYSILENIYRANILQSIEDKKNVIVDIQMLNFYLEDALRKEIIKPKKFLTYSKHLTELDKMTRAWFFNEESS